ncbi:MAG: hypothetical protein ACI8RD_014862, partial [Bacillariaceae sp.]
SGCRDVAILLLVIIFSRNPLAINLYFSRKVITIASFVLEVLLIHTHVSIRDIAKRVPYQFLFCPYPYIITSIARS